MPQVYCLFLKFLARLVVSFLQPAEATLRQVFPELLFMLEDRHWFRALMEESLAVAWQSCQLTLISHVTPEGLGAY